MDCIQFEWIYVTGPCQISRQSVLIVVFNKRLKSTKNKSVFKKIKGSFPGPPGLPCCILFYFIFSVALLHICKGMFNVFC